MQNTQRNHHLLQAFGKFSFLLLRSENKHEAKRRRTERVRREKINSTVNKDLENRKRSRSNSHSDHIRRGRGRPKSASAKKHEEEREKQEKEIDIYANLSDEKAFVFSVALAEINRKIINQRLILWYLSEKCVETFFRITSANSRTVTDSQERSDCINKGHRLFFSPLSFSLCHIWEQNSRLGLFWDFLVYQGVLSVFCVWDISKYIFTTPPPPQKTGWLLKDKGVGVGVEVWKLGR